MLQQLTSPLRCEDLRLPGGCPTEGIRCKQYYDKINSVTYSVSRWRLVKRTLKNDDGANSDDSDADSDDRQ